MDPPKFKLVPFPGGGFRVHFRLKCGCVTPNGLVPDAEVAEALAAEFNDQVCPHHLQSWSQDVTRDFIWSLQDRFYGPPKPATLN